MEARPTIGVLSPFVSGFYFGGVISGIAGVAAEAGVRLLAIQTSDPGVDYSERPLSSQHPHAAAWEHLEGCIVVVDAATPGYLDAIRRTGKPIVTVSKQLDGFRCPTVQPDNRAGVRMAMRHLLDHGHRRIAFAGTMAQDDIRERYEAYVEMLGEAGIDEDPSLVYTTADNAESFGYETGNRMLANGMASTALLAASDLVAIGVIQAFTAAGLELPRDQAIVGFDDIEAASFVKPTLSSVRQDFGALGRLAASLLLDKLRGVEVADERHDAPVRFVARESCGCIDTAVGSPSRPVRVRGLTARRRWLAGQLDATLLADGDDDGRAATVDHAARLIAQSMEAAAKREPGRPPRPGQPDQHGPSEAAMAEALEALYRRSPRNQTVRGVMEAARQYGRELLACKVIDQGSAARSVANCVIDITVAMSAIHSRNQFGDNTYFRAALASQYSLSMDLLR
ncbi:MAG: hypothetical protein QOJ62_559, partial [Actinomycetota bacterium]|nr:hypothetical protein [Actinomycetota bacterium]